MTGTHCGYPGSEGQAGKPLAGEGPVFGESVQAGRG